MIVFAVVYGNYFPQEIDSLWSTREKAQARRALMHAQPGSTGMWEVSEMTIDPEIGGDE